MAKYVKCPRCDLNYMLKGEEYCDVCKAELKLGPQLLFALDEDEAGEGEKLFIGLFRAAAVHLGLVQGPRVFGPKGNVILQDHLAVIVGAGGVAIDAVGNIEVLLPVFFSESRGKGGAVNAAAAVAVAWCGIVIGDLLQIHRLHDPVFFRVHVGPGDLIHVKNRHVEAVLGNLRFSQVFQNSPANGILLKFQGAVYLAVFVVVGDAAQMPHKAGDTADEIARHVRFHKAGGKGKIEVLPLSTEIV